MDFEIAFAERLQRLTGHDRSQIAAADANVDDIRDRLTGVAAPGSGTDRLGPFAHVLEHRVDLRHDILAIHHDGPVRAISQRDVQHGSVFGCVDPRPGEHLLGPARQIGLLRQIAQQRHRLGGDAVLRVVEQRVFESQRELVEAVGVLLKQIAQVDRSQFLLM